jgi:cyclopropane fatty-acyl-phospholipid synthase-like methyltransferase
MKSQQTITMAKKETVSKDVKHLYTEEYFMGSATGHDEFRTFNGKYDQLLDKFQMVVEHLKLEKTDSFLDIGCGRGELVIYHAITGGKSTGVDFSEEAIKLATEKARELKANCSFIISSFETIDEFTKFDKIVSLDFIEHISVEEGKTFFAKCYNLLTPGGRLVMYTYPNTVRRRYGYKLIRALSIIKGKPMPKMEPDTVSDHYKQYHLNEQSYFSLKKSAENSGFKKVKVQYFDMSIKDSYLKTLLINTPFRHLFLKGLTLIADK